MIPPRNNEKTTVEQIDMENIDRGALEMAIEKMQSIESNGVYGKIVLREYIELFHIIQDTIRN